MHNHRILSLLCALVLAAGLLPAAVLAEAPDLASMSDEALLALYDRLNEEVVRRGLPRTATLPKGTYIAGEDLPAGRYIYTCLATGDEWGNVTVYSDRGNGSQKQWEVVLAPEEGQEPETFMVNLEEGDALRSQVNFSLTIFTGIVFR